MIKGITLVPLGGLCNRLRAVMSAMALAEACNVALRVVWLRDKGLGARFSDLFQPVEGIIESASWMRYGVARRRNLWLPSLWQRCTYDCRITESDLAAILDRDDSETSKAEAVLQRMHGNVLIQTGLGFYPCDDRQFTQRFIPSEAVRQLLAPRLAMITPHTVGVHIRRTDNAQAILHSPLSAFEQAMEEDLERDPETQFYVATDDPSILTTLANRFPTQVSELGPKKAEVRTKKSPTRSTVSGMQDAVADLFTLIACPRFHGSYWSSFSDTVVACHDPEKANIIFQNIP